MSVHWLDLRSLFNFEEEFFEIICHKSCRLLQTPTLAASYIMTWIDLGWTSLRLQSVHGIAPTTLQISSASRSWSGIFRVAFSHNKIHYKVEL